MVVEKKLEPKQAAKKNDTVNENKASGAKRPVEDDTDMPEPDTKDYGPTQAQQRQRQGAQTPNSGISIFLKPQFKAELEKTIGNLGYNRELGIPERHIQIFQIFDIIKRYAGTPMTEQQLNELLNIIALAPFNVIAGFMEKVRSPKGQEEFWTVKKNS